MKKAKKSIMGSAKQRRARAKKKMGRFVVDVIPRVVPSSGERDNVAYNERIAYKEAWRAERKAKVDQIVLDQVVARIPLSQMANALNVVRKLEFKQGKHLPSKTHVRLAEAAKKRYVKKLTKLVERMAYAIEILK